MPGRYELLKRLAVGGMAEIHLARTTGVGGFEKLVVLKRILPQLARDEDLVRMMLDEARLMATLSHPHIAQVYDVGIDDGQHFFAMEHVHGEDLREVQRAAGGALPLGVALAIVGAAAAGLHHAHEKRDAGGEPLGIVHRDVSPSNVLVGYDGVVKVTDFGIAKWAAQRTETRAGTVKGKLGYMSPEQCRAEPLDRRSDVFGLGILLYEATCGRKPFEAASDFELLSRIVGSDAPPPSRARGDYPPALAAIVMKALARDRDERYATAEEMRLALEAFARDAGLDTSAAAVRAEMERLFGGKVTAWHQAEQSGATLIEHIANQAPATLTATEAVTPAMTATATATRPAGRAWPLALGVLLVVGGGAAAALLLREPAPTPSPTPAPVVRPPPRAPRAIDPPAPAPAPPTTPAPTPTAAVPKARATQATPRRRPAPSPSPEAKPAETAAPKQRIWDMDSAKPPE